MSFILFMITLILALALLIPFYRIIKGPTIYDRMLGVGVMGSQAVVLICLVGVVYERIEMFVDISIAYSLLNFITALLVASYLERKKHIGEEA